jgi:hypothetical protein
MDDEAPLELVGHQAPSRHTTGAGTRRHRPVRASRRVRRHPRTVRVREVDVDQRRALHTPRPRTPHSRPRRRLRPSARDRHRRSRCQSPGLARQRVVRRDRHSGAGAVGPRHRLGRVDRLPIADVLVDTIHSPSTLFVRTNPDQAEAVRDVLARSVEPESPDDVEVSRPSPSSSVGVGITHVMFISVLERRAVCGGSPVVPRRRSASASSSASPPPCAPPALTPPTPSAPRDGVAHSYG